MEFFRRPCIDSECTASDIQTNPLLNHSENLYVGTSFVSLKQTPQRFHDRKDWADPDPLGNQAATQFDIVNSGRDGAGGALSCGQGSVWRVQVSRMFLLLLPLFFV